MQSHNFTSSIIYLLAYTNGLKCLELVILFYIAVDLAILAPRCMVWSQSSRYISNIELGKVYLDLACLYAVAMQVL